MLRFLGLICTTPRTGTTALCDSVRAVLPGIGEHPFAKEHSGVLVTVLHLPFDVEQLPPAEVTRHVFIERDNKIAQAVSFVWAHQTGRWHTNRILPSSGNPVYDEEAIEVALRAFSEQERSWEEWLSGKQVLRLEYGRDLAPDYEEAGRRLLRWFGLSGESRKPTIAQLDQSAKRAWIEKFALQEARKV